MAGYLNCNMRFGQVSASYNIVISNVYIRMVIRPVIRIWKTIPISWLPTPYDYNTTNTTMPWTCPKCDRTLSRPNAWHQCMRKPLKDVFVRKEPHVYQLFLGLQKKISKWKNVKASATENCVVYVAESSFLIVRPMKAALELKFFLYENLEEFPVYKTEPWGKRIVHYIRLFDQGDLDEVVWKLLRLAYTSDVEKR